MDQRAIAERAIALALPPIDATKPCPYAFESEPIFISIDVEANEMNHNAITEIGIATLDTRDIKLLPPGAEGRNWRSSMRCRHFRIEEWKHHVNHRYVHGCPQSFEFGDSEFVYLKDAKYAIEECFEPPYSRTLSKEEIAQIDATFDMNKPQRGAEEKAEKRQIILVGHNPGADIDYLNKIGYNVLSPDNVVETMDTASLWRAISPGSATDLSREHSVPSRHDGLELAQRRQRCCVHSAGHARDCRPRSYSTRRPESPGGAGGA